MIATVGDVAILGIGAGSTGLVLACGAALWLSSNFERRHVWEVVDQDEASGSGGGGAVEDKDRLESWPLRKLVLATGTVAAMILVGGFFLSASADAIATSAGLASGMVGFVLVGLSTSLPEISSITAAVRMRRYDMAVGDIFGTNLFNIALIFLADLIYDGEPVLSLAGQFEVIGAILAILLTGIFIVGLLERRDRAFLRMGYDSLAAILVFAGGVFVLARTGG
jgi:cation:H+ antiporter